ncbi:hypothetical protein F4827_006242 [Paraburkholderia bannensis]|uniref:Uncharacterized protein n=1 Tax=Paraburkholderia bannensis TaxID=765414 RepID=A0A7W9U3I0_9BURK|nr:MULTISPECIES: hypothetical protein [Paraburkholderia]MBB3261405.1 hypothetical protein [Paraburkholderia sp. WP4_3_2]MBB6106367.1 hypothetical protein [Paraburkholderia bannensis]
MKILMTTIAALVATAGSALPHAVCAAGNAHSAATAGMTWHGDPISGPTSPLPQAQQAQLADKKQGADTPANPPMMQTAPASTGQ